MGWNKHSTRSEKKSSGGSYHHRNTNLFPQRPSLDSAPKGIDGEPLTGFPYASRFHEYLQQIKKPLDWPQARRIAQELNDIEKDEQTVGNDPHVSRYIAHIREALAPVIGIQNPVKRDNSPSLDEILEKVPATLESGVIVRAHGVEEPREKRRTEYGFGGNYGYSRNPQPSFSVRSGNTYARVWADDIEDGDYVELTRDTSGGRTSGFYGERRVEPGNGRFWHGRKISRIEAILSKVPTLLDHDEVYIPLVEEAKKAINGALMLLARIREEANQAGTGRAQFYARVDKIETEIRPYFRLIRSERSPEIPAEKEFNDARPKYFSAVSHTMSVIGDMAIVRRSIPSQPPYEQPRGTGIESV